MLVCLFVFVVSPCFVFVFFFKQKTAYEMRISDWSSDVCSSDLIAGEPQRADLDVELAIARAQADAAAGYPGLARRRLAPLAAAYPGDRRIQRLLGDMEVAEGALALGAARYRNLARSEERRVGKECVSTCRSRCSPYQ